MKMTSQNDSPNYQEAYEAALGAFSSEKPAFRQLFFENVTATDLIKANELDADEETAQEALDDLERNLRAHIFCARCRSAIVFHADKSFHCSCDSLEEDETEIPAHWSLTEEERAEMIESEDEYASKE